MEAYGGWNITSDYDKILNGFTVFLQPPLAPSSTKNGIIVDYFQYRVDTDLTTRLQNIAVSSTSWC